MTYLKKNITFVDIKKITVYIYFCIHIEFNLKISCCCCYYCLLQLPVATFYCYCFLLLLIFTEIFCCLLLLLTHCIRRSFILPLRCIYALLLYCPDAASDALSLFCPPSDVLMNLGAPSIFTVNCFIWKYTLVTWFYKLWDFLFVYLLHHIFASVLGFYKKSTLHILIVLNNLN